MKALSIKQPWAWLIVHGYKDVENRGWPTPIRERVLVHAPRTIDHNAYGYVHLRAPELLDVVPSSHELLVGGIVGDVQVTGCVRRSDSRWFEGPFGFLLAAPTVRPFLPLRGALGFFDVPDHLLTAANGHGAL